MNLTAQIISFFMESRPWVWLLRKVISVLHFRLIGYPKYKIEKYYQIRNILRDNLDTKKIYGFVSKDSQSLSYIFNRIFTGAKWSHAGVVQLLEDGEVGIVHMLGNGMNFDYLIELLKECDEFKLLELPFDEEEQSTAKSRLEKLITVSNQIDYDFGFSISHEALDYVEGKISIKNTSKRLKLYCSELCWVLGVKEGNEFALRKIQGKEVFEPDDVIAISKVIF